MVDDTIKPARRSDRAPGKVTSGHAAASATTVDAHRRRRAARRDPRQPLGDAPAALGAQARCSATHVAQKGSLVAPDRLRFDFSHFAPHDRRARSGASRTWSTTRSATTRRARPRCSRIDEAKKLGAVALFGEKYGDACASCASARDSVELCGGTHVRRAGDIGLFKITRRDRHRAGRAPHRGGDRRGRARLRAQGSRASSRGPPARSRAAVEVGRRGRQAARGAARRSGSEIEDLQAQAGHRRRRARSHVEVARGRTA